MTEPQKLKMFVWENVLEDYTPGLIVALAHNLEEAKQVVMEKAKKDSGEYWESTGYRTGNKDTFESTMKYSSVQVVESPAAFFVYGGG